MTFDLHNRKNELARAYSDLGSALQQVSHAAQAFGLAIGHLGQAELATIDQDTINALVNPIMGGAPVAGVPVPAVRIADHESDDEEGEGKKKRRKREKKPKDPNAPKRPPSAYLLFQNAVRQEYREREPSDTPYAEVLRKISNAWQAMDEEQRRPWVSAQEENLRNYETARDTYYAENPELAPKSWEEGRRASDIQVGASTDTGHGTTISKSGHEYPGKKRGRKSKAEKAAIEAEKLAQAAVASASTSGTAAAVPVPAAAPVASTSAESAKKKEKKDKKEKKKKEPTPPPVASSTSESSSDDSSDDDSDDSDSSDSAPKAVSPSKKVATPSGDKHKSKKSKH